jgi:hypothetical protein
MAWIKVMWDVWLTKWHEGGFSLSTFVSFANAHSTEFSLLIYPPALVCTIGQSMANIPSEIEP